MKKELLPIVIILIFLLASSCKQQVVVPDASLKTITDMKIETKVAFSFDSVKKAIVTNNSGKKVLDIADEYLSAYAEGYQVGSGLSIASSPWIFPSRYFVTFDHNSAENYEQNAGTWDIFTEYPGDTSHHVGHTLLYTNRAANHVWVGALPTSNYLETHFGDDIYNTLKRLGFVDGAGSTSGNDYKRSIIVNGSFVTLPWPTNCKGCEAF